jgi:hypothetical protein
VGAVATIVSGVAAENDPGADAVRRDCVGLGESCPTYQKGRDAQLRTNVILGVTGVLGVATAVVGVFFTHWSAPPAAARARPQSGAISVVPDLVVGADRRALGLRGAF